MELTLEMFVAIEAITIGILIALLVAIIGFLFGINRSISEMKGGFNVFANTFSAIANQPPTELINAIRKIKGGNPYNPERKKYLLSKWQQGILTLQEAQELRSILQEDAKIATVETLGAVLLGLALIGALIYLLLRK